MPRSRKPFNNKQKDEVKNVFAPSKRKVIPSRIININRDGNIKTKSNTGKEVVYISVTLSKIQQLQSQIDISKVPSEFDIVKVDNKKEFIDLLKFYNERLKKLAENYKKIDNIRIDPSNSNFLEFEELGIVKINDSYKRESYFQALNLHKRLIRETINWFSNIEEPQPNTTSEKTYNNWIDREKRRKENKISAYTNSNYMKYI